MEQTADHEQTWAALAMVLLDDGQRIDDDSCATAWSELWTEIDALGPTTRSDNHSTFTGDLGRGIYGVSVIPARIPESELSGPSTTSWLWPDAIEAVDRHVAHAIVFVRSPESAEVAHRDATRLVAAVLQASQGLGVYVGGAGMLVRADVYTGLAVDFDPMLADQLWIDFRCFRSGDNSTSLFTVGLSGFGCMELEVAESVQPCGGLREFTMNIAGYLTANGPVINDGDTVGGTEDERIQVRYADSLIERPGPVIRLVGL